MTGLDSFSDYEGFQPFGLDRFHCILTFPSLFHINQILSMVLSKNEAGGDSLYIKIMNETVQIHFLRPKNNSSYVHHLGSPIYRGNIF